MTVSNDRQCGRSPMDFFCHAQDRIFTYIYANETATAYRELKKKMQTAMYKVFPRTPSIDIFHK